MIAGLEKSGFKDSFKVECEEMAVIDWIYHCKGDIESDFPFESMDKFSEPNGYDQIRDLRRFKTNNQWSVGWQMMNGRLNLNFEGALDTEVFVGRCFCSNGLENLGMVFVRRNGKETSFNARFQYNKN